MALAKRRNPLPTESSPQPQPRNPSHLVVGIPPTSAFVRPPARVEQSIARPATQSSSSIQRSKPAAAGIRHTSTAPVNQPIHAPRQSHSEVERQHEVLSGQIAKNLILARHALGVTQEALAHESGVSRATIAQIESGVSDARIGTLSDLSRALGISPAILFLRPEDLTTLLKFVRQSAIEHVLQSLTPRDLDNMNRLRQTGLQKDLLKSAQSGIDAAKNAGYRSPGAIVGASIGSTVQPGLGTAIGTLLGVVLDNGQNQSGDLLQDGDGI